MPWYHQAFELGLAVLGGETAEELIERAPRPSRMAVYVEQATQDRIFIHVYDDRPPYIFRLTLEDIKRARLELQRIEARHHN